jgi:hypothetical protein
MDPVTVGIVAFVVLFILLAMGPIRGCSFLHAIRASSLHSYGRVGANGGNFLCCI